MDRVFESGAAGSPPSAPASPSSGYPTAGNPQTATPPTKLGPWWYHMMTEELRAVIVAAGLTPDHTDVSQLKKAIQALLVASSVHGQCVLAKSGANLLLSPFNGNKLLINGQSQTIPAAGVPLAATGLTADTNYYIYAYMNAGTMTLEASATGHSTDASTGVEIKTGDSSRTLVGFARVVAGPAWSDTAATRFVRSWFNEPRKVLQNNFSSSKTTASATYVEIAGGTTGEGRLAALFWSGESVEAFFSGIGNVNASGTTQFTAIYMDGVAQPGVSSEAQVGGTNNSFALAVSISIASITEGYHYFNVNGKTTGGTATWIGGSAPDGGTIHAQIGR